MLYLPHCLLGQQNWTVVWLWVRTGRVPGASYMYFIVGKIVCHGWGLGGAP